MKARFTNIDIVAGVKELQQYIGLRVTNVYDVDRKVYLFKFAKPDSKVLLLIESGIRFHTTEFEWPKNNSPSGFAMKLRKHIKNRRLEHVQQLGVDRIIDMQFGSREAAYHVILELYDRGNLVLTDHQYNILNILRPRTDQDTDVRFAVHEKYPLDAAKQWSATLNKHQLREIFSQLTSKEQLKKVLNSRLFYGAALVEHVLISAGLKPNMKVDKSTDYDTIIPQILEALKLAETLYKAAAEKISSGYITYRSEEKLNGEVKEECKVYDEYHPFLFEQLKEKNIIEKPSFLNAVDEFYSSLESQRLDMNILDQQKQALKKLENVQKDHEKRLQDLRSKQEKEQLQARVIEENVELVDHVIVYMRTLMAAGLSWPDMAEMLDRRRERGDEIAERIIKADIPRNAITIALDNKNEDIEDMDSEEADDVVKVEVLLNQSAFQNVTRLHTAKKQAATKESKTIEASAIALKNAERKTKQALKDVAIIGSITKARKVLWFEKFFWFISSDKLLVIGGRDAQQNEIIVKRYMQATDLYVHADLHGASSIVIKNPSGLPVPPKTLTEAGVMSISYSGAWEAKVPAKAWWVYSHQVTKTAPSGEYLGTGSFMIRGKKNFIPPLTMVMGFGVVFKIDQESVKNHADQSEKSDFDTQSSINDAVEDEDVVLEVEEDGDEKADGPKDAFEEGDGVNLIKNLASKILSSSDDKEESTLVTATTGGIVPVVKKQQQAQPDNGKKIEEGKGDGKKKKDDKKQSSTEAVNKGKQKKEDDDDDWSDYKKKKGKSAPRQIKDPNRKHQELPAKIPKKKEKTSKESASAPEVTENLKETVETDEVENVTVDGKPAAEDEAVESSENKDPKGTEEIGPEDDREDDDDLPTTNTEEADVFSTLVPALHPDDNCLFCIPVCAPYLAMQHYKLKVKLLPGTAKRGKAAKACFQTFINDKTLTAKEKDVLKSIKDQDLSRNFPGNVKLAVTQQKFKQKKK